MFRDLINGIVDLVWPKVCLGCKKKISAASVDNLICGGCWSEIKRNLPPFCHCCGRRLGKINPAKNICPGCVKKRFNFDRAFSPCVYDGRIKELIQEFKYKGKDYLGLTLGRLMVEFIKEYNLPIEYLDFVIPVPLHPRRMREREFNQAEVLSNHIASQFGKEVLSNVLRRHRYTQTQTDLEVNQRLLNVRGSFAVKDMEKIRGRNLLLVDDVLTTGATSSEAAAALKEAGAKIVFVLTLAN